jgi:hypothetical protein
MGLAPLLVAVLPLLSAPAAAQSAIEPGVAALAKLLSHPDERVRDEAAKGLVKLGSAVELGFPALLDAIAAGEGPRATAADLIERLGPRAAALVPGLVAWGRGGDPAARPWVVARLLALSPWIKGGEGFLAETLTTASGETREEAARALLIADPTRTAARDLLGEAIRNGSAERDLRLAAALGRSGLDVALSKWIVRALADDDVANRRFAEEALARVDGRSAAAVPALQQGLLSDDAEIQDLCAGALGRIGAASKDSRAALAKLLGSPVASVRHAAARALARMQPAHAGTAEEILAALAGDREYQDELAAILCELEPEVAARALGERFDRGDATKKSAAIALADVLLERGAREGVDAAATAEQMRLALHGRALAASAASLLQRATKAPEAEARRAAIAAIGRRFDAAARRPLVQAALADPDAGVRGEALALVVESREEAGAVEPALLSPPAGGDPAVGAKAVAALAQRLLDGGAARLGANLREPARFGADELMELCAGTGEVELAGFALRDAEVAELLDVAAAPDEARGRLAARALARGAGPLSPAAIERLGKAIEAGPAWTKEVAVSLLDAAHADAAAAAPLLVRSLAEPALAEAARRSLATHGRGAVEPLAAALADPARRLAAIEGLGALGRDARGALPRLVALLEDPDDAAALAALRSIERIVTDGRLERVEEQLGDLGRRVR